MKKIGFLVAVMICLLSNSSVVFSQGGGVYTIAGGGTSTANGVPATSASLNNPGGVGVDAAGNVYFLELGSKKIKKVNNADGKIYTVAGNGVIGFSGDGGPATNASLGAMSGIYVDPSGNIYIPTQGRIRKVDAISGIINTIAGGGSLLADGVSAVSAKLDTPLLTVSGDASGNIYCAGINSIRKINASGIITTVAGGGASTADGIPATAATIPSGTRSISVDGSGNIYFIDPFGDYIRKIDAVTGIINTIAGGSSMGDGIPATTAWLNGIQCIRVDAIGNVFIPQRHNRIQRIDAATGIINNIVGTGGSSAEGAPALSAIVEPSQLCLDPIRGNIYYSDVGVVYKIRKVSYYPISGSVTGHSSDSLKISTNKLCNGPDITIMTPNYITGRSVKTYFGDGNADSGAIFPGVTSAGYTSVKHTYYTAGTYTIKHVLYLGAIIVDTISYSYVYNFCRTLPVNLYYDRNGNCIKESTEPFAILPTITEVDSNGVAVDTLSAISGFSYNAYGIPGDIYSFKVLSSASALIATCPTVGFVSDTIQSVINSYPAQYIGLTCSSGAAFDLSVNAVIPVTGRRDQWGNIYVRNNSCYPVNATVTLHYSSKYSAGPPTTSVVPSSISPGTITWDIMGLSADATTFATLYYSVWSPTSVLLPISDTVNSYVTVTPTTGDIYVPNNMIIRVDTVRAACDPNFVEVTPPGCFLVDTQFQYTIHFENTGTDTSHNIYVLDTLSNYLDAHSLRIVAASAAMNIDIQKHDDNNVVRFDFPNIMLPDSSHHGLCDGAVIFTIRTKTNVPYGTIIRNRAGIYFDINEVVMTNTVENTKGCPVPAFVPVIQNAQNVEIYPNPTTDEVTIKMEKGAYNTYTITNSIGQVLMQQSLNGSLTKVNVKTLPAGLYYVTVKGDNGSKVQKFVKL